MMQWTFAVIIRTIYDISKVLLGYFEDFVVVYPHKILILGGGRSPKISGHSNAHTVQAK